jgi:hypothetical protein
VSTLAAPTRSTPVPVRSLATLSALVVGLGVAFVVVPPWLATRGSAHDLANRHRLGIAVRRAVAGYWRSGDRGFPPALQQIVDYWFRFHLIKAGIAALGLITLGTLAVLLWRTFQQAGALRASGRAGLVAAGTGVSVLALGALTAVMANLQGAVAPFASLLPLLMDGTPDARVARVLAQARSQLAGSHLTSGYTPPALDVMVSDFSRYHVALAVMAAVAALVLLGLSAVSWRTFARAGSAQRRVWAWFGASSAVLSLAALVLLVANLSVVREPAPALLSLFSGGF